MRLIGVCRADIRIPKGCGKRLVFPSPDAVLIAEYGRGFWYLLCAECDAVYHQEFPSRCPSIGAELDAAYCECGSLDGTTSEVHSSWCPERVDPNCHVAPRYRRFTIPPPPGWIPNPSRCPDEE